MIFVWFGYGSSNPHGAYGGTSGGISPHSMLTESENPYLILVFRRCYAECISAKLRKRPIWTSPMHFGYGCRVMDVRCGMVPHKARGFSPFFLRAFFLDGGLRISMSKLK